MSGRSSSSFLSDPFDLNNIYSRTRVATATRSRVAPTAHPRFDPRSVLLYCVVPQLTLTTLRMRSKRSFLLEYTAFRRMLRRHRVVAAGAAVGQASCGRTVWHTPSLTGHPVCLRAHACCGSVVVATRRGLQRRDVSRHGPRRAEDVQRIRGIFVTHVAGF